MTESVDVTPKTTVHNLMVRSGKSEAEVTMTNNKRLRSRRCSVEPLTDTKHCAVSLR